VLNPTSDESKRKDKLKKEKMNTQNQNNIQGTRAGLAPFNSLFTSSTNMHMWCCCCCMR